MWTEFAQCPFVEFWFGETLVASKGTTADLFGHKHILGACLGYAHDGVSHAHLTGRACDMDGYARVQRGYFQLAQYIFVDEFGRFV